MTNMEEDIEHVLRIGEEQKESYCKGENIHNGNPEHNGVHLIQNQLHFDAQVQVLNHFVHLLSLRQKSSLEPHITIFLCKEVLFRVKSLIGVFLVTLDFLLIIINFFNVKLFLSDTSFV